MLQSPLVIGESGDGETLEKYPFAGSKQQELEATAIKPISYAQSIFHMCTKWRSVEHTSYRAHETIKALGACLKTDRNHQGRY